MADIDTDLDQHVRKVLGVGPDATADEMDKLAARLLVDTEFETDIINYVGPIGEHAVDARVVHPQNPKNLEKSGKKLNMLGLYTRKEAEGTMFSEAFNLAKKDMKKWGLQDFRLSPNEIAVIGSQGITKETIGHEFLHKSADEGNFHPTSEKFVRSFLAYRADNPTSWQESVRDWQTVLIGQGESASLEEAEKDLTAYLDRNRDRYARLESEATMRLPEGVRPPIRAKEEDDTSWPEGDIHAYKKMFVNDYERRKKGRNNNDN